MATLKISSDLQNVIKKVVLDTYFPVGKTYITMGNEDPNETIGGTWEKISGGYLYATESTSLSKTTYNGWGTQSHTLNVDQMPRHGHWILALNKSPDGYDYSSDMDCYATGDKVVVNYGTTYHAYERGWGNTVGMQMTGGNQGHTHDIATIDVFIWKRIK